MGVDQLLKKIDSINIAEAPRNYLGASIIGEECERQLYYGFKNYPKKDFPTRVKRIFKLGHILEPEIVKILRDAGYKVWEEDENGEQFRFRMFDGKFSGGCDGVIVLDGTPHLLEIKTYNKARFAKLIKDGVRHSDPKYFAQMQIYMKHFRLKKALLFVYCKDNSELHGEIISYDEYEAQMIEAKAKRIITATKPLEKAYDRATHWKCKFCDHHATCWR